MDCNPVATVRSSFAREVCLEGSGRTQDGTVINVNGECDCGFACSGTGATVCFMTLDGTNNPWGVGFRDNPLVPLRSLAVDNRVIPFGTVLYAPVWDGVAITGKDGVDSITHDGCFRADDMGYGISGHHVDFFVGPKSMWLPLEGVVESESQQFSLYRDGAKCSYLGR